MSRPIAGSLVLLVVVACGVASQNSPGKPVDTKSAGPAAAQAAPAAPAASQAKPGAQSAPPGAQNQTPARGASSYAGVNEEPFAAVKQRMSAERAGIEARTRACSRALRPRPTARPRASRCRAASRCRRGVRVKLPPGVDLGRARRA